MLNQHNRGVTLWGGCCPFMTGRQTKIKDAEWRDRTGRPRCAWPLAGNHPNGSSPLGKIHARDLRAGDCLITRRRHLLPGRQIHPQLDHLERAAGPGELAAMKLGMHDTRTRGHPLHVARPNGTVATGRVVMFQAPLIDNSNRLEPAMRVLAHSTLVVGW